jgi:hypothetical protein
MKRDVVLQIDKKSQQAKKGRKERCKNNNIYDNVFFH